MTYIKNVTRKNMTYLGYLDRLKLFLNNIFGWSVAAIILKRCNRCNSLLFYLLQPLQILGFFVLLLIVFSGVTWSNISNISLFRIILNKGYFFANSLIRIVLNRSYKNLTNQ